MGSRSHDYFVKVNNFHCWKGKCYGGMIIPPSLTERMSEAEHLTSLAKSNKLFSAVGERPLIAPVVRWGPRGNKIRSVGERPLILQLVLTQLILTQLILTCCFGGEVRTQGQQNQIFYTPFASLSSLFSSLRMTVSCLWLLVQSVGSAHTNYILPQLLLLSNQFLELEVNGCGSGC